MHVCRRICLKSFVGHMLYIEWRVEMWPSKNKSKRVKAISYLDEHIIELLTGQYRENLFSWRYGRLYQ
jgi:hypothetical protein